MKRNRNIWAGIYPGYRHREVTRFAVEPEITAGVSANLGSDAASAEVTVMEPEPGVYVFTAWRREPGKMLARIAEWTETAKHREEAKP